MKMTLAQIAALVPGSRVRGAPRGAAALGGSVGGACGVCGVSTDSRHTQPGALFVALRGPRFDGHDHARQAIERGAAALLVERPLEIDVPQLVVDDGRRALGLLAAGWRAGFRIPVIAVAGSNGKTTVTQMIAAIMEQAFGAAPAVGAPPDGASAWLATRGNLNNDIGLPLMLCELAPQHRAAVFELGMNHPGEIAQLAQWARPTVALVNNAQREHQEFMASVEATAHENGAALAALAADGVAIFPADDGCAAIWRRIAATRRVLDFARREAAAVTGQFTLLDDGSLLSMATPLGVIETRLRVAGEHNVHNALAACAGALAIGIDARSIGAGLGAFAAVPGRGARLRSAAGALLIDDAYNANPDSVRAAIDVLARAAPPRVLVLGDMGEVGAHGPQFHREIGAYAAQCGIELLLASGPQSVAAVHAFGAAGRHFTTVESLCAAARAVDAADRTFLVKGSRSMRMERVLAALSGAGG